MGHPQVYIQKLTIGIELIYSIHIYTTADTLQKLNDCKSCSPALVCVCLPIVFAHPCLFLHLPSLIHIHLPSFVFAFALPHSCSPSLIHVHPSLFVCAFNHCPAAIVASICCWCSFSLVPATWSHWSGLHSCSFGLVCLC